jgi:cell division septum initiation protein DivIVA
MSFEAPKLRRTVLGGYQADDVERLLAERDTVMRQSEERVRTAEARITELEEQLQATRPVVHGAPPPQPAAKPDEPPATPETGEGHPEPGEPKREPGEPQPAPQSGARYLADEMARILSAAEESAVRIIERARAGTEEQVRDAQRLLGDVREEVARYVAWREGVDPALRAAGEKVGRVRSEIAEMPERIRRALDPLADSMTAMESDLAVLGGMADAPLILDPSGLQDRAAKKSAVGLEEDVVDLRGEPSPAGGPGEAERESLAHPAGTEGGEWGAVPEADPAMEALSAGSGGDNAEGSFPSSHGPS